MGALGRVLAVSAPGAADDYWYQPRGSTSVAGVPVTTETALTLPAFYAGITAIAETVGTTPFDMYERVTVQGQPGKRSADNHPLDDVIHATPNAIQSAAEFWEWTVAIAILRGRAVSEIVPGPRGAVDQLIPLHPDLVTPRRSGDERIWEYRDPKLNFQTRTLMSDEVFVLRGRLGIGLLEVARDSIGISLAMQRHQGQLFSRGARHHGVIKHPGKLSPTARTELQKEIDKFTINGQFSGRPMLLEDGMEWINAGFSDRESQLADLLRMSVLDAARWLRIQPTKLQELGDATFCLPGGELVFTADGPRPIKDITPGTLVWSRPSGGGVELARVRATAISGYQRVLTVRTETRTLRLTANHPILARRPVRVAAAGLRGIGDRDGLQTRGWTTEYVPAGELRVGDTIVELDRLPDQGTRHAPTRPDVSVGFMEFAGLLIGDGTVGRKTVAIARAATAGYMDHYRDVMRREFHALAGGGHGGRKGWHPRSIKLDEGDRYTRFGSIVAAEELRFLGLAGTAHTKRVPGWVFGLTAELRLAFLRGFLDADGTVNKLGRIAFSSSNRSLAEDVRHLCMGLGIPVTNIRTMPARDGWLNGRPVIARGPHYMFTCSDPGANRRIGSHDQRYMERLAAGQPFTPKKARAYPRFGGRGFAEPGLGLARIVAIEEGRLAEPVYDLQVEGTASFVASGVVVHNTNVEHLGIEFVTDTIRPWCVRIEQATNRDLVVARARFFAEHNLEGLLRGDIATRYAAYAIAIQWGWMTPNEVRARENLNPIPGGDRPMRPLNMTTEQGAKATAYLRLMARDQAARAVRKETAAIAKLAEHRGDAWTDGVREFYDEHAGFVARLLRLEGDTAEAYARGQASKVIATGHLDDELDRAEDLTSLALATVADLQVETRPAQAAQPGPDLLAFLQDRAAHPPASFVKGTVR